MSDKPGEYVKDTQSVRYIGYESSPKGGRCLDFSYGLGSETRSVAIEIAWSLLQTGPNRIAIQETTAICYETLKARLLVEVPPARFGLTAEDIAKHRKIVLSRVQRRLQG